MKIGKKVSSKSGKLDKSNDYGDKPVDRKSGGLNILGKLFKKKSKVEKN